jgi:O-antigen/teichoic acid export membrane protein
LASQKYAEAYKVLPYIIIGHGVYASTVILNSGLFIRKKTYLYTLIMMLACILNIILNLILIPSFGIIGAAQATLISYICYAIAITYFAFKEFRFTIEYKRIFSYLGISLLMFIVIKDVYLQCQLFHLVIRIGMGVIIYFSLIIALDSELRNKCIDLSMRFRNKWQAGILFKD